MGNAPIQLGLKTHKQSYHHGETMTGTVYVSVSSINPTIQSYQGIRLQFAGHENTEVRVEENSGETKTFKTVRESPCILRVEVPLITFQSPLRVAKYEFPFEWSLPDTPLPSSFKYQIPLDRKGFCEVRYTLTAYLIPQEQGVFGAPNTSSLNGRSAATCASQTIHFIGAPTRSIPEPINIAEERTTMNGFCCCWKLGHVSLGFEANSVVLTPQAPCQLLIWGSNSSALTVQYLRVQVVQSIKWQAGSEHEQRHTRSHNTMLVDYKIDVSHLPQWDPVLPSKRNNDNRDYQAANQQPNEDDIPQQPFDTTFQVPPDVMDSYQGLNCTVEHTLMISAVTRMMATTPQVSYNLHVQRTGPNNTSTSSSLPVATAWMEEAEYQDAILPSDWAADEKVPVIHLRENDVTTLNNVGNAVANGNLATAQAVALDPPMNPSMAAVPYRPAAATIYPYSSTDYPPPAAIAYPPAATSDDPMAFARPEGMTDEIVMPTAPPMEHQFTDLHQFQSILRQMDPNDVSGTHLRRVEQQIRQSPACQKVLATMTPEDYQYLCQVGTPLTISRIAVLLATELNNYHGGGAGEGFGGAFLVALMQLPVAQETSVSLIGSLVEHVTDLEQSSDYVQLSLRPEDAQWFKQRLDDWAY